LGHEVIIYDNNIRHGKINKEKNFLYINGDIRDLKKLLEISKKVNSIIHCAYINGTRYFYERPDLVTDVAIRGMLNVIDTCKINKINEIYLISSSEVYHLPKIIPTPENIQLVIPDIKNPRFSYGGGKIASELMLTHLSKNLKKTIIIRPHNVYGENMGWEHVIPEIIKKFHLIKSKKNKIINIEGTGHETRAFIYIEDFIRAFEVILKRGKNKEIYNIGSNQEIKISKLIKIIGNILKIKFKIKKSRLKSGSAKRRCPSINKIKKLGYTSKVKLEEGLKKTIQDYTKALKEKVGTGNQKIYTAKI
jgi:nucleoside-diphosphate-sugar epimerase